MLMSGADPQELVKLSFSKRQARSQLKWKHAKEFAYKGNMYDVVDSLVQDGSVTYWCWLDSEETKLNRLLTSLAGKAFGKDTGQREQQQRLLNLYYSLYHAPASLWKPEIWHELPGNNLPYLVHFGHYSQPPSVPPPEMA